MKMEAGWRVNQWRSKQVDHITGERANPQTGWPVDEL